MTLERLRELEEANRKAHEAFVAAIRKQRDTLRPPRGAVAAYHRMLAADRAYTYAQQAYTAQQESQRTA
jgi:hypothetical protein